MVADTVFYIVGYIMGTFVFYTSALLFAMIYYDLKLRWVLKTNLADNYKLKNVWPMDLSKFFTKNRSLVFTLGFIPDRPEQLHQWAAATGWGTPNINITARFGESEISFLCDQHIHLKEAGIPLFKQEWDDEENRDELSSRI